MNIRNFSFKRAAACVLALGAAMQLSPAIAAEAEPQQVLDRVFTYTGGSVLNMAFGNAVRPPDFTNLGLSASSISTCTLTSVDGLWCLDGKNLRRWPNPLDPTLRNDVLNCNDSALGFDTTISASCTGMAVDKSGSIWLSGKKRLPNNWPPRPWWIPADVWMALQTWFKPYSLVKVVEKQGTCASGFTQLAGNPAYCAKEFYSGRYTVTNLNPVDGDAAEGFRPCPSCSVQGGILAVEDLRNVVFFPDSQAAQPVVISGGWNTALKFGELLQDVALLQLPGVSGKQNHVLATTSNGRVMSKNTASGALPVQVFNIPNERAPGSAKCSNSSADFGVRTSPTASIVFVTDRQYCQVAALVPNGSTFSFLVNLPKPGGGGDFTLKTKDSSGTFAVIGLTIAPGIGVDFRACTLNCAIVNGANGAPAAELQDVKLAQGSSFSATVFQVEDLPDCRYAAQPTFPTDKRALCASKSPGVVVNPDGSHPTIHPGTGAISPYFPPASQLLNVTPLLPSDVTSAFDDLPELLISRQYRGQSRNNFLFGALFIAPGPGVRYTGVFGSEYDVPALEGVAADSSLGCTPTSNLLEWDVTTAVSESFVSIGGRHIDSLANVGCGSIRGEYSRLSLLPYDLEVAPDTYWPTVTSPEVPQLTTGNDAVFARLVDSLIDDLGYVFNELACEAVDNPSGGAPLPVEVCGSESQATEHVYFIRAKFDRCLLGVFDSLAEDNAKYDPDRPYCEAVLDRFTLLQQTLPRDEEGNVLTAAHDIANRAGEIDSRVNILRHVYTTRFLPSVTPAGFQSEQPSD